MARTPSTMVALGSKAADFTLPDAHGNTLALASLRGKPVLIMFICNHCPYVKHIRAGLAALGRDYGDKGLAIVAINSNDADAYPDDSPEMMLREATDAGYTFPYLVDATQAVARAYDAACTPDFFLFDANHTLIYRGQFDDSRPNSGTAVTGNDLRTALDATLAGHAVATQQRPSIGCNIKWKQS